MKIVYLADSEVPSRTANSIHVMRMCDAFTELGHDVILCLPPRREPAYASIKDIKDYYGVQHTFEIFRLPFSTVCRYTEAPFLFAHRFVEKHFGTIDLAYGRSVYGCLSFARKNTPTAFEAHAPLWLESSVKNFFFKKLIQTPRFLKLVVITHALKQLFLNAEKVVPTPILVAPDATHSSEPTNLTTDWPGRKNTVQIGYSGHMYEGRGIDLLLAIAKSMPNVDFHLIGGTTEDIERYQSRNTPANVFFHGFVPPSSLPALLQCCDILVAPYQSKVRTAGNTGDTSAYMSPLKIFEYMMAGKAIVASDLPVLREILHEKNAILVPHDKPDAWLHALRSLLHNPVLRARLGKQARDEALSKYTWTARAQHILSNLGLDSP